MICSVEIRDKIAGEIVRIQATGQSCGTDWMYSASLACGELNRTSMSRPKMNEKGLIDIKAGRHPVVEKMITNDMFIANDTFLDNGAHRISIITGPQHGWKIYLYAADSA